MRGESEGERSSARLALLANLISVKVNSGKSKFSCYPGGLVFFFLPCLGNVSIIPLFLSH